MAKEQIKATDLSGRNIYIDNRGRVVYSDMLTKDGYIITNNDVGTFNIYSLRLAGAFIVAAIVAFMYGSEMLPYALMGGLLFYVVASIFFYLRFLPTLPIIPNFEKPPHEPFIKETAKENSRSAIIMTIVAALLFSLIVGAAALQQESVNFIFIVDLIVLLASITFAVMNVAALFTRIRMEKDHPEIVEEEKKLREKEKAEKERARAKLEKEKAEKNRKKK